MGRIGHLAIMGALLSLAAIRPAAAGTVAFTPAAFPSSGYAATLDIGSETITASCSASACANFELSQAGSGLAFTVSSSTGSLLSSTNGASNDLTISIDVSGPTSISNALFTFTETGATSTDAGLMVPSATPYDGNTQPLLSNPLTPTVSSTSLSVIAAQEALSSSTTYLSIAPDLLINSGGTGTLAYTSITFGLNVPVPEPSSALLVLSALGVVGAGAMWGRRRAA